MTLKRLPCPSCRWGFTLWSEYGGWCGRCATWVRRRGNGKITRDGRSRTLEVGGGRVVLPGQNTAAYITEVLSLFESGKLRP